MTYKERQKWFCEQCRHKNDCGFYTHGYQNRCLPNNDFMEAWEKGQEDTLEEIGRLLPSGDDRNLNDYGKALVWRINEKILKLKEEL